MQLLALLLVVPVLVGAINGTLDVTWQPNTESDLAGYVLYWGTQSGPPYTNKTSLLTSTSYTLNGLDPTATYYLALTAFDVAGNESAFSLETAVQPSVPVCGDGVLDPGEGCDDGNVNSGDGCSSTCQTEAVPVVTQAENASTGTPYLMQCTQSTVRVAGSNFQSGASLSLTDGSITVSSTTFVSSTELTAVVDVGSSTSVGAKTVTVTNPDTSSASVSGSQSVEVIKNPDFSKNGQVGAEDLFLLAIAFGSQTGDGNYNASVDMNDNGLVDGEDLNRFAPSLGLMVTPCP